MAQATYGDFGGRKVSEKARYDIDFDFIRGSEATVATGYVPLQRNGRPSLTSGATFGSGVDLGSKNETWFRDLEFDDAKVKRQVLDKLRPYFGMRGITVLMALRLYENPLDLDQGPADSFTFLQRAYERTKTTQVADLAKGRQTRVVAAGSSEHQAAMTLTPEEVQALDNAVRVYMVETIVRHYNRAADTKKTGQFASLPGAIQTAIVSFCWQNGEHTGLLKERQGEKGLGKAKRGFWDAVTGHDWDEAIRVLLWYGAMIGDRSRRAAEAALMLPYAGATILKLDMMKTIA